MKTDGPVEEINQASRTPPQTPKETIILVAEDEVIVRNFVVLMLAREGYIVLTASDGQEALELAGNFTSPIHLLLTDVRMPRMDGLALAENFEHSGPIRRLSSCRQKL